MIRLRRLGHKTDVFYLNPDLIVSIESTPDTVVTLTTHTKLIVADSHEDVVEAVRLWRASVLNATMPQRGPRRSDGPLTLVRGAAAEPVSPDPEERKR